jgi:alpha-mannosidase
VGWLSRDDFPTRNFTNAGPTLPTPAAQCLGRHTFRYALVPFAGDHLAGGIAGTSRQYRVPLLAVQGVEDRSLPGGDSLVRKSSSHTCISAIKKHDTRESLVVRLYNLSNAPLTEILTFGLPLQAAWCTDLLEERAEPLAPDNEAQLSVRLRPHEIVTLEVEFGRRV